QSSENLPAHLRRARALAARASSPLRLGAFARDFLPADRGSQFPRRPRLSLGRFDPVRFLPSLPPAFLMKRRRLISPSSEGRLSARVRIRWPLAALTACAADPTVASIPTGDAQAILLAVESPDLAVYAFEPAGHHPPALIDAKSKLTAL